MKHSRHVRKACIVILTLLMMVVSVSSAFAESTATDAKEKDVKVKKIRDADKVQIKDVMKIAEYHINGYMKNDLQTIGRKIEPSKSIIDLYDLEGNVFAYLVPLIDSDIHEEIGYITIGAISDGYDFYEININDTIVEKIKNSTNRKNGEEVKVIFIPTTNYLLEIMGKEDHEPRYVDISQIDHQADVTLIIKEKKSKIIENNYNHIRQDENKRLISQMIQGNTNASTLSVPSENVSLTVERDYGMFVPVEYSPGVYSYGGDQMWWEDNSQKENRGCGPVAAANITNYLSKITNSSSYGNLYSGSTTSYSDFMKHMNKMYDLMGPGPLGETSLGDFESTVENYATSVGVNLSAFHYNIPFTLDNTATYIKNGLSYNVPVATLNLSYFSSYEYKWHWMTITKYFRDSNDNRYIAVSTWGERRSINYRTHFDAMNSILGGGLLWFA